VSEKTARVIRRSVQVHDDKGPSLKVTQEKGGKILLYCHTGCSVNNIVAALGVEMKDLFPEKPGKTGKRIVVTYDYQSPDGETLFQVIRFAPKDFRQHWAGLNRSLTACPKL